MSHFDDLTKSIKDLKKSTEGIFNSTLTPEVLAAMTPEQKEMVNKGMNAFNMSGMKPEEKLSQLTKDLSDVNSYIKREV